MSARTTGLIVGGLAVLGAAVVLVIMLSTSSKDVAQGSDTAAKPVATGSSVEPRPSLGSPSVTVTDKPRGETTAPVTDQGRDYTMGSARVRDHRSGEQKPLDVPPNIHPTESRLISSDLTYEISQKVKDVLKDCVANLPKDGRGAKPRVEGQLVVAIKDKMLSVTSSTIVMRDLEGLGAAADSAQQCIQSHSVGLSTPAGGEADLDAYTINLSLAVP